MPVVINNQTYYMIAEACAMASTNRNTLLRWIREGRYADVKTRDRNGWRLFSIEDVERLKCQVNKIEEVYTPEPHKSSVTTH
jgi:predicted site-specific integrase-resolvase